MSPPIPYNHAGDYFNTFFWKTAKQSCGWDSTLLSPVHGSPLPYSVIWITIVVMDSSSAAAAAYQWHQVSLHWPGKAWQWDISLVCATTKGFLSVLTKHPPKRHESWLALIFRIGLPLQALEKSYHILRVHVSFKSVYILLFIFSAIAYNQLLSTTSGRVSADGHSCPVSANTVVLTLTTARPCWRSNGKTWLSSTYCLRTKNNQSRAYWLLAYICMYWS